MAHPLHHAQSSARKFGGVAQDYQHIHDWFDASKAHCALPQHRALRHHSAGIFDAEALFGTSIVNAQGREIPVRWIGEQHVREDCRRIPSLQDWFCDIPLQPWMANGRLLQDEIGPPRDPRAAWTAAVTAGQTVSGLDDWIAAQSSR